jgi:hypothetical protein
MNRGDTATIIVDAAIAVQPALGPGLPESANQKCLARALRKRERISGFSSIGTSS